MRANHREQAEPSAGDSPEAREQEHLEQLARAHQALAEAQERSYWLDRWRIDLNQLMERPAAQRMHLAARVARRARKVAIETRRRIGQEAVELRAEGGDEAGATIGENPFERSIPPDRLTSGPVTELLYGRLRPDDIAAVEERLRPDERELLAKYDALDRKRLLLSLGVHHEVPGVLERMQLTPAMPPSDVHAMARGAAATGGSPYYADIVAQALASSDLGIELEPGTRGLDFGCSSGRAVRVLAAAHPDCEWHGCDPIGDAIAWARENIDGVSFVHSPEEPPLPYDDASFDFAFAISIWSHFAERGAIAWLDEMHRLIRPGGALVLTTHGYQTLSHDFLRRVRSAEQLEEVRAAMYRSGFWFKDEFGQGGDHGVDNADWGTAFLTPEWLLRSIGSRWRVSAFGPGRIEDNQDLYVLERR